jgi:hypothetical protein
MEGAKLADFSRLGGPQKVAPELIVRPRLTPQLRRGSEHPILGQPKIPFVALQALNTSSIPASIDIFCSEPSVFIAPSRSRTIPP